jgi:hypothetical protein
MRGSLKQRYPGSWSLILDLDRETDPATGVHTIVDGSMIV